MQALKEDVLTNKFIWLFALAYFFVYVVRQGVTSWFVFYLKVRPTLLPGNLTGVALAAGMLSLQLNPAHTLASSCRSVSLQGGG